MIYLRGEGIYFRGLSDQLRELVIKEGSTYDPNWGWCREENGKQP